ncbi:MAG: ATP-binding protein, partial [Tenericutes bacterium]|nr:ATP-binding protein [Mycoplasmatota bacterium]
MINFKACKESLNPTNVLDWASYKIKFRKEHPDYFDPDGLVVFTGPQGTGKTLSAVNYVENLMKMYPKAKLVTNLVLKDYPIVSFKDFYDTYFQCIPDDYKKTHTEKEIKKHIFRLYLQYNRVFEFSNSDDLSIYSNGEFGVIYLIDEIQLYFNSLASKNINPDV